MTNRELERILEFQEQARKIWQANGAEILRRIQLFEETCNRVWDRFGPQLQERWDYFQKNIAPHLDDFLRAIEALPPRIKKVLLFFAATGWFLSPWLKFVEFRELQSLSEQEDYAALDRTMAAYFRSETDEIQHSLENQFPSRANILNSAFALHKDGKFEASIPLFLIQADGICHDILGVQLFRQVKPGVPATAKVFEDSSLDPFDAAVIEPLRVLLPVSYHTTKIDLSASILNRHAILHGLTTAYPSEINSLKAMSLLYYVSLIECPVKQQHEAAT